MFRFRWREPNVEDDGDNRSGDERSDHRPECRFISGATLVIADQRLNYSCGDALSLYGEPERHQDRRWKIYAAPQGATELTQVDIAIAWF